MKFHTASAKVVILQNPSYKKALNINISHGFLENKVNTEKGKKGGEGEMNHVTYRFMSCHLYDKFLMGILIQEMPKPKLMPKKNLF